MKDKPKPIELDLQGASCASCIFAIEHAGRKIKGVKDIKVDSLRSKIVINLDEKENDNQTEITDRVIKIVRTIGYDAQHPQT
jgi:cation transport ATPase